MKNFMKLFNQMSLKKLFFFIFFLFSFFLGMSQKPVKTISRPNVIIILTDDQGYGDMGIHQNPIIKTPVLDKFASSSIRFTNFYVSPVCSPTRSSILTGKYNIRTGVFDTFSGGAIMASNEITIAELFKDSGYKTGQFGKWHLGDNYPFRPQDQGFDNTVSNIGGGIGSPGDVFNYYKADSSYFNPILMKDGEIFQSSGYCTDVFTDEAIKFIERNHDSPFFIYLAYNAPHKPLQLPESYYNMYKDKPINPDFFRQNGFYVHDMSEKDKEDARKVYGMVTNIDDNIGRLFQTLEKQNLDENTVIIFMTDNGPAQNRFTGGYRGKKSMVNEGGIHVPFYIKLPKKMTSVTKIDQAFAHIDILPTLVELCNVKMPPQLKIDGVSMVPFLTKINDVKLDRPLFFEWQRGYPEKYKNIAVIQNGFKLIGNIGENDPISSFELYDLKKDPFESINLIEEQKDKAKLLKNEIDGWFEDIMKSPNILELPKTIIGNQKQNPIILTRNDARGIQEIRDQDNIPVSWDVIVEKEGDYEVTCYFYNDIVDSGKLIFRIGRKNISLENDKKNIRKIKFNKMYLDKGSFKIDSWYSINTRSFLTPFYIEIKKL